MKAVVQRVRQASVTVEGESVGAIGAGLLVLLGVAQGDTEADLAYLADKVAGLRIFEDEQGKMNLSVEDVGGAVLVVSQFTLLADCRKGRRPGFAAAAAPAEARLMYLRYVDLLRHRGLVVATGRFQAEMQVALINDGPVTLVLESRP